MKKILFFITICMLIIFSGCTTNNNNEANNQGENNAVQNNDPLNNQDTEPDIPEPTMTPFVPVDFPGWPIHTQFIMDCKTSDNVVEGQRIAPDPGCDLWGINRYERPFNAQSQDQFYPDLDLLFMETGQSGDWYYVRLGLDDHNPDNDTLPGIYGLEIDFDMDGRGDLLLLAKQPQESDGGTEWFFKNSEVWVDEDQDVGADTPRYADKPNDPDDTNGYDELLLNLGQLWSRSNHKEEQFLEVEFAFKVDLLENNSKFILTGWSFYQEAPAPEAFDLHDTYENQDAGDVYPTAPYYPAFKISAMDNTCGMLIGGAEDEDPNLCINDPDTSWYIPSYDGEPGDDCPVMDFEEWKAWWYSENPQFYPQPYSLMLSYYQNYVDDSNCYPPPTHTPPPGDCPPLDLQTWKDNWYAENPQAYPQPYSLMLTYYQDYLDLQNCETPTPPPPPEDDGCEHMNFDDWKDWWYSMNPGAWPQPYSLMLSYYDQYLQYIIVECPTPTPNTCPPADFEGWKAWWYAQNPGSYPQPYSMLLGYYQNYIESADPECIPTPTPTPTPTATATRRPSPTRTPTPTNPPPPPPEPTECAEEDRSGNCICRDVTGAEVPCD